MKGRDRDKIMEEVNISIIIIKLMKIFIKSEIISKFEDSTFFCNKITLSINSNYLILLFSKPIFTNRISILIQFNINFIIEDNKFDYNLKNTVVR